MTTVTTTGSPKAWGLDVLGVKPEQVIPEALILQITSKAGFVEGDSPAVRVPAIRIDPDDIGFVPEGQNIDEADPELAELVLHTGKIAHLIKVSREQIAQPEALTTILQGQKRALIAKADKAMLQTAAPVAPATYPPAGLLAHAQDAGPVGTNLDALIDAETLVTSLPGGVATHVLASPNSYAYVRKLRKGTGSNENLLGAGTESGPKTVLGLPALITSAMPDNKIAVIDKGQILSAYGDVMVARSDEFYFDSDNVALRATFRFGVGLLDPQAVQVLTLPED
ncbi:phage major capsid protein [Mycobacterium sp. LTG2003]